MEDWDAWDESADEALICAVRTIATTDGVSVLYQPEGTDNTLYATALLEIEFMIDTGAELKVFSSDLLKKHEIPLSGIINTAGGPTGKKFSLKQTAPVTIAIGEGDGEVLWNLRRLKREDLLEHPAWAKGRNDCGLLEMEPVRLTGKPPPCVKQCPIKNGQIVAELLDAMQLPEELAVIKVKAHTRQDTIEVRGNAMADAVSRTAARKREGGDNETTNENGHGNGNTDGSNGNRNIFENDNEKCMMRVTKKVKETSEEGKRESLANIIDMQNSSSREEKWIWIENVAKLHDDNLWRFGTRTVAPESLLPYLTAQIHSLGHVGVEKIRNRFIQVWWSPKFTATATDIVKWCVICRQNNHDKKVKLPMLKTPAPPGLFRVLQIDYITLPKCKGYRDVLVVLCKFSWWIEAFPARSGIALHTAKVLVKDIIPRCGLP
ncbi:uncharacterized protein LOC125311501 [Alosa alosa]|uniref:uncharacterized protein LOC125311501 n=1 Tax=Alosa alosa TaxID=278164 RepID=UPI002015245C|nr:uncharacterized protein LOC125311501 [Alosa alosa]